MNGRLPLMTFSQEKNRNLSTGGRKVAGKRGTNRERTGREGFEQKKGRKMWAGKGERSLEEKTTLISNRHHPLGQEREEQGGGPDIWLRSRPDRRLQGKGVFEEKKRYGGTKRVIFSFVTGKGESFSGLGGYPVKVAMERRGCNGGKGSCAGGTEKGSTGEPRLRGILVGGTKKSLRRAKYEHGGD